MISKRSLLIGLALLLAVSAPAAAQKTIRIGAIDPLTGGTGSAGTALRDAAEIAAEIINNSHPEVSALPLASTSGLPGLGGRKVKPVFADHQGNPAVAQNQALRLITQEKIVALVGA